MNNKQKIKILESYQSNPMVHPLTCGNNSSHQNLIPVEENGEVILKCLDCDYTQTLDDEFIKLLDKLDKVQRSMIEKYKKMIEEDNKLKEMKMKGNLIH
jgi:Zn-finger protein